MSHKMMFDLKSHAFGEAHARFQKTHPEYERTRKLDEVRAKEYARLDAAGHIYLDYTGGGLYADSQIREHQAGSEEPSACPLSES